jgi:hypothetical protein
MAKITSKSIILPNLVYKKGQYVKQVVGHPAAAAASVAAAAAAPVALRSKHALHSKIALPPSSAAAAPAAAAAAPAAAPAAAAVVAKEDALRSKVALPASSDELETETPFKKADEAHFLTPTSHKRAFDEGGPAKSTPMSVCGAKRMVPSDFAVAKKYTLAQVSDMPRGWTAYTYSRRGDKIFLGPEVSGWRVFARSFKEMMEIVEGA